MSSTLYRNVWRRAGGKCEYYRLPEIADPLPFQIDHIVSKQHGGTTVIDNLALSCLFCNSHKGPNIAGVDPINGRVTRLFHPRHDNWSRHFHWNGPTLVGRTAVGRTTIYVLSINDPENVSLRRELIANRDFPG